MYFRPKCLVLFILCLPFSGGDAFALHKRFIETLNELESSSHQFHWTQDKQNNLSKNKNSDGALKIKRTVDMHFTDVVKRSTREVLRHQDLIPKIFIFLDLKSFERAQMACKRWKLLSKFTYKPLPTNPQGMSNFLSLGVTQPVLNRITKDPEGIKKLRKFFLSYFDQGLDERMFDRREQELYLTKQIEKKESEQILIQYKEHAQIWRPYGVALGILSAFKDPMNLSNHIKQGSIKLSLSQVCFPFFTGEKQNTYDSARAKIQSDICSRFFLDSYPFLLLNAWKMRDIPHQNRIYEAICEKLISLGKEQYDLAKEKKQIKYFENALHTWNKLLKLKGDNITANEFRRAANINNNAYTYSDKKKMRKIYSANAAHYANNFLKIQGQNATAQDFGGTAIYCINAAKSSDNKKEKKNYIDKAAHYCDYVLEIQRQKATVQNFRITAAIYELAGKYSDNEKEKKIYLDKAAESKRRMEEGKSDTQ